MKEKKVNKAFSFWCNVLSLIMLLTLLIPIFSIIKLVSPSFGLDGNGVTLDEETEEEQNEDTADLTQVEYESYMQAYFNGLTQNFPYNRYNSWGYVALSQLLSYYDNYLDDYIVAETYDRSSTNESYDFVEFNNSPWVLNDYFAIPSNVIAYGNQYEYYYGMMNQMAESSLQARLMLISEALGIFDYTENADMGLTTCSERVSILNRYLRVSRGYEYIDECDHQKVCSRCGTLGQIEHHSLQGTYIDSTSHLIYCEDCNYSEVENHTYCYLSTSGLTHIKYCICSGGSCSHQMEYVDGVYLCILCGYPVNTGDVSSFELTGLPWYFPWGWDYIV